LRREIALDQELLEALRRLEVMPAQAATARLEGARASARAGAGIEFADWRPYATGDSLRDVDWRALARWGRLFVRLRAREEATTVCLLVDASSSMAFGRPTKFTFARRLAAALAASALAGLDAVLAGYLRGASCELAEPVTGERALVQVLEFLERGRADGQTDLPRALASFLERSSARAARTGGRGGALVVFSDFWSEGDLDGTLGSAAQAGFQGALVQVLEPEEAEPRLGGRSRLTDSETGAELELEVSRAAREAYAREREAFLQALTRTAARWGFRAAALMSDVPLERATLGELRAAGVLG